MRNDAFNNLLDALAVVAEFEMYEVVILNKFQVFRANRSSKVVIRFIIQFAGRFDTICSPNYPSLIEIKIDFSKYETMQVYGISFCYPSQPSRWSTLINFVRILR
jgi:L-asparaginase/Glu-tRNA(Gln) amidotransferase subunit D